MKKLTIVVGSVVGIVLLFTAIVVAINALDEPLSPRAQALVKELELDVNPGEGYDYLLGLMAPADQDPLLAGRKIREQSRIMRGTNLIAYSSSVSKDNLQVESRSFLCDGIASHPVYCGKDWYRARANEIASLANENKVLLARFDKLTSFASLNTDPLARSLAETNVLAVHQLLRIKQDVWGLHWTNGNKESVLREWTDSNRFFNRWLAATPVSMLEAVIVLHMLESQKKFALEILKDDPSSTVHFNSENLLTLKPTVSFERLQKNVTSSEFTLFYSVARMNPTYGSILDMGLSDHREKKSFVDQIPIPLLKQNATLNSFVQFAYEAQQAPCVTNEAPCESSVKKPSFTLINPVGNGLVATLSASTATYEKMYLKYSSVSGI